jgi:Ni/Co efflux regulator RcnB
MKRLVISIVALALLAGFGMGAQAQDNPLGQAVAQLFNDRQQVRHAAYAAWRTARDKGPRVSMEISVALLQKATASTDLIPAQAAPDAFAAWWYNIAAQYWCEIAARKPGGEGFIKAIEGIKIAREDLERALGWDAGISQQAFRDAYRIMHDFK